MGGHTDGSILQGGVEKYSFNRKGPTLLKNLSPLLSGALLSALDAMHDGQTLTLVGSGYPEDQITAPVVHLGDDVTTEAAAEAILSVFPLDQQDASPIVFLDLAEEPYDVPDVAFAVNGIASDAELRRVPMTRLELDPFLELARTAAVTVRVGSDAPPCAFLFRRGTL
ncbi:MULTISPECIES: RbsD/FucU domain-containing protein [unclassified Leifsonia]|uniref:RbsD/FucU domain-containing protein n=1 Tax=unclassified Leifsonia TaxID=2663824 RepID=UPI0019F8F3A2|nr:MULTISPECIES: RbsD/FucU domain-containing protein [unclassified Leifsonia]